LIIAGPFVPRTYPQIATFGTGKTNPEPLGRPKLNLGIGFIH